MSNLLEKFEDNVLKSINKCIGGQRSPTSSPDCDSGKDYVETTKATTGSAHPDRGEVICVEPRVFNGSNSSSLFVSTSVLF